MSTNPKQTTTFGSHVFGSTRFASGDIGCFRFLPSLEGFDYLMKESSKNPDYKSEIVEVLIIIIEEFWLNHLKITIIIENTRSLFENCCDDYRNLPKNSDSGRKLPTKTDNNRKLPINSDI